MVFIKTNRKLLCLQQSKSQTSEGYEFQTLLRGCSANFMMYQRIHQNALSSKLLTNMTNGKKKQQPAMYQMYIYIYISCSKMGAFPICHVSFSEPSVFHILQIQDRCKGIRQEGIGNKETFGRHQLRSKAISIIF